LPRNVREINPMVNLHFSKLLIAESIPAGEFRSGRCLYEALEPLPAVLNLPIQIAYTSVPTRAAFEAFIGGTIDEIAHGHTPVLHIECHGNDDGIGLANGRDFIAWEELRDYLAPLNVATRMNLMVSIAACYGVYAIKELLPSARAPFLAALSTDREAHPDELYRGFAAFYRTLLETLDGDQALQQIRHNGPGAPFFFIDALAHFKLIYRNYLARMCTPKEYRRRALRIQEEQRESGGRVADVDDIAKLLLANQQSDFERLWREHFLIDLYPGNAARFPVTYADVALGER
jgi:hypothetical protein